MAKERFTADDYLSGKIAPEGRGLVETVLGVVPAEVGNPDERDRHFARHGRKIAKDRRAARVVNIVTMPESKRIKAVVERTKFVNSRLTRLPLEDKRLKGLEVSLRPHRAEAIVREHNVAVFMGNIDAAQRNDDLVLSSRVDALLAEGRGE